MRNRAHSLLGALARPLLCPVAMLRTLSLLALASFSSACWHHAPSPLLADDPENAAAALAKRDGPFAVDAKGRWQPIVDASVRFVGVRGARVQLLGLDARGDSVAVALAHEGAVDFAGERLASGRGVVLALLDATGGLRWKIDFAGGRLEVTRLRLAADGTVVLSGRSDGQVVPERGKLSDDEFVFIVDGRGDKPWSTSWPREHYGRTTAVDVRSFGDLVHAGELDGPKPGVEPWHAYVEGSGRETSLPRQVFGSDHPVHLSALDSFEGWGVVAGTFEGTLAAGGRPPIQSGSRTTFVAAFEPEGRVAWMAPLYPPTSGATLDPIALAADDRGVHLGLAAEHGRSLIEAHLGGDGTVIVSCELTQPGKREVRELGFAGELTYVLLGDGALFFSPGCKLDARLEPKPGERLVAVRPVDTRVLVGVDAGASSELRWLRK